MRLEPLDGLAAAPQLAHEHRGDQPPLVGDGVVEREGLDRGQPHAVAVGHLHEHDPRVGDLPVGRDVGGPLAEGLQTHGFAQPQPFAQEVAVGLLAARDAVALPDRFGEVDVRRRGHGAAEVDHAVAAVRVADLLRGADRHRIAVVGLVGRPDGHPRILEQREHRRELEGRTRLHAAPYGVVLALGVAAVGVAPEVGHGEDLARGDLHDDGRAPDGVLGLQLAAQRLVGHVLQLEVERRHHVEAVLGVLLPAPRHAAVEAPRDALPQRLAVAARELLAVDRLDAVVAPVARQADRAARQFALRVDAVVALDEAVDHAHVPVQQRVAPQRLPLGVVDLAGEDVDRRVVADRVVDAPRDELLAAQPVKKAREPPLGADVGRVAAPHEAVAAVVLTPQQAPVLRGRAVAEEGREELGERVGLLVEGLQRVEARRAEVEGGPVAEERGGERFAVAREDAAPLRRDALLGEDAPREAAGVVVDLGAEELHPHEPPEHDGAREDEQHVEQPYPQQDVAFDLRGFAFHGQSSSVSPGVRGSCRSMPRSRSRAATAEWVVRR